MDSEDPGSASGIEFLEPQTANEDEEDIGGLAAIEETSFPIVSRNALHPELVKKHGIAVVVPPVQRRSEYKVYHGLAVSEILEEVEDVDTGDIYYIIIFEDGHEEEVSQLQSPILYKIPELHLLTHSYIAPMLSLLLPALSSLQLFLTKYPPLPLAVLFNTSSIKFPHTAFRLLGTVHLRHPLHPLHIL